MPSVRWLLLPLVLATCQRPGPGPSTPSDAEAPEPPAAQPREPTPAADPTHPLELVPARARVMLMARSPQRLAQVWGRDQIMGRFPSHYERLVSEMERDIGHDLLDPNELAALGLDPTAPMGLAVLSFQDEAVVLFGGAPDPQRMLDGIGGLFAARGLKLESPQAAGEATLQRLTEDVTLVLRHRMAALVLVDRHRQGMPDYAREIARIDPAQSLAHAHAMQRAHTGLPHEADLQGLLDVAGLVADAFEHSRRIEQEALADQGRMLAEARQRGASTEELESIQQSLQQQQAFMARRQREQQIAELLLSRTLGAIEGIGLAVDADDRGLRGRIHLALGPDAAFRDLLVDSPRPPAALAALTDAPQLVMSGELDVGVAIDLFAQAALAAGASYAEVNEEARKGLGLDFDRQLRPLLDGRATFALTSRPLPAKARTKDFASTLGGIVAVGVEDEAKAKALLQEVVAKQRDHDKGMPSSVRIEAAEEIGGFVITLPEAPGTLWVGVVAKQLVASNDLPTLRRLRDGQAGPAGSQLVDPEAWQRLTEGPGAARLAMHHRLPLATVFAFLAGFDAFDFVPDVDDELREEFPEDDLFSIPRGKATVRLQAQLDRALQKKRQLRRQRSEEQQMQAWTVADALGMTAGVVRKTDTGLMIEGGHYVKGGLAGYVEGMISLSELEDEARTSVDAELERATQRADETRERLLKARRKEIRKALSKRSSTSSAVRAQPDDGAR
ncbi:hypothetical protein [Paraliomyxa miuraensis]|uniref:hypothetical protein n=1 Tax=Paraliomyxa miuraensis TaxID=376150 RepID=UPI002251243C|nr:hypothetical protein [Paraliomyxa miuraensis]MCX4246939.1 DUF3352 domain-containing protein [Paraliomyxa miuraensis]